MTTKNIHTPRAGTGAFTLIELLTVIAIIAILASILIPTVGKVRESANRAHCGSNLRQVGQAVLAYESENGHLPGPTGRLVQSPLAGDDLAGANTPRSQWSESNIALALRLEEYIGTYTEGDPGPFFCRSNYENTEGDDRAGVFVLHRNNNTNPQTFFGSMEFGDSDERRHPKSIEQLVHAFRRNVTGKMPLTQIWMIADIDNLIYTNAGGFQVDWGPPHDGGRNMVFFDGHLEFVTAEANGQWGYPANSGQPESLDNSRY